MLTHRIIQGEIEELKQILAHKDLEIPPFWHCVWPGLVCMLWFLSSSYFSYWQNEYATALDKMAAMIFALAMSVFSVVTISNIRGLFLSLPVSFRKKSIIFKCLSIKCRVYGVFILILFSCFAFTFSYYTVNAIVFCVVTGFCNILIIMVMNIDLGRYQLATLTSVIELFKGKGAK